MVEPAAGTVVVGDVDQLVCGDREAEPGALLGAVVELDPLVEPVAEELLDELAGRADVGGATIRQGDAVVLDTDGVAVVEQERVAEVLAAARDRAAREVEKRAKLEGGALSYDLDGLRALVEK